MSVSATHPFLFPHATEEGRVVRGRVHLPGGSAPAKGWPTALVLHGFKGFMDWGFFPLLARGLAERGVAAVAFNFSGSGIGADLESFSEPEAFAKDTFSRQLEDVDLVRTSLACDGLPLDLQRVGIFGHSRGGGVALLHASEAGGLRAIVTWAAIPSVMRFDAATCAQWRERGFLLIPNARLGVEHRLDIDALRDVEDNRERFDILAACARIHSRVLVVQGGEDDVVEPAAASILRSALPENCAMELLIPGAGHTFGARHPLTDVPEPLERALESTWSWFVEHLDVPVAVESASRHQSQDHGA